MRQFLTIFGICLILVLLSSSVLGINIPEGGLNQTIPYDYTNSSNIILNGEFLLGQYFNGDSYPPIYINNWDVKSSGPWDSAPDEMAWWNSRFGKQGVVGFHLDYNGWICDEQIINQSFIVPFTADIIDVFASHTKFGAQTIHQSNSEFRVYIDGVLKGTHSYTSLSEVDFHIYVDVSAYRGQLINLQLVRPYTNLGHCILNLDSVKIGDYHPSNIYGPYTSSDFFNTVSFESDCLSSEYNISRTNVDFSNLNNYDNHIFSDQGTEFYLSVNNNSCSWIFMEVSNSTFPGVVVDLVAPEEYYYNQVNQFVNLTFNASVSSNSSLTNCNLWTNISGSWDSVLNESKSGISNYTNFTLYDLHETSFEWNIECTDSEFKSSFATNNRTVVLNWSEEVIPEEYFTFLSNGSLFDYHYASDGQFNNTKYNLSLHGIELNNTNYNGSFIFPIFEKNVNTIWENVSLNYNFQGNPTSINQSVNLYVRVCNLPDCSDSNFSIVSVEGTQLNLLGQYFQYKIDINTSDTLLSPLIHNITIFYREVSPVLEGFLVSPNSSIIKIQGELFNITTSVRCSFGYCGNVTASLDPEVSETIVASSYQNLLPYSISNISLGLRFENSDKGLRQYSSNILSKIVSNKNPEDRLNEIKVSIRENNAKWTPGLTETALMTLEDKQNILGNYVIPSVDDPFVESISVFAAEELPFSFDWRDYNGKNWMTPVRNQGSCGSCWSFSALGVVESVYNIFSNNPNLDLDLSEQQLVSNDGSCCSYCGSCNGGWMHLALDYVKNIGVSEESCFSYTARNSACSLCNNWDQDRYYLTDYFKITPNSRDSIKQALMEFGPLSIGMEASDMFTYYVDGIYEELEDINFTGLNHGVVLVGWNDASNYWIIKNSWGTSWGQSGYGKLSYGDFESWGYIYGIKVNDLKFKGVIPMNSGSPFYTINQNPVYSSNDSCLENMSAGDICNLSWTVNSTATGKWEFFTIYETNSLYSETSKFNVTIYEDNPPAIEINNPLDNEIRSDNENIIFNCSATDDWNLKNISFYITNSTNHMLNLNATSNASGIYNDTFWVLQLPKGTYTWSCGAEDNFSQTTFGENRTLFVFHNTTNYNFTKIVNGLDEYDFGYQSGSLVNLTFDETSNSLELLSGYYSGSYVSQIFDANKVSNWINLSWVNSTSCIESCNTNMNAKIRACSLSDCSDVDYLFTGSSNMFDLDFESRYFQYQFYFNSNNISESPRLHNVTINYNDTDAKPFVILNEPIDNYYVETFFPIDLTLNATVSDDYGLENCSLWHNMSGAWSKNNSQFVFGVNNHTTFDLISISNTEFIWNINCFDSNNRNSFAVDNSTVIILHRDQNFDFTYLTDGISTLNYGYQNATLESIIYNESIKSIESYRNTNGTYTSQIFDLGTEIIFHNLSWINFTNNHGYTSEQKLNVSVRSCDNANCSSDLTFYEDWNYVGANSPQNIYLSSNRYFQYKVEFEIDRYGISQQLSNVTLFYSDKDQEPNVYLDFPSSNYYNDVDEFVNLTLNASIASDDSLANCSLWTNLSDDWTSNQYADISGVSNSTSFNLENLKDTIFIWNIKCSDINGVEGFGALNRSAIINWTYGDVAKNITFIVNDTGSISYGHSAGTLTDLKYNYSQYALMLNNSLIGEYISEIYDAGNVVNWTEISWVSSGIDASSKLNLTVQLCNDDLCNDNTIVENMDISPQNINLFARYIRYTVSFVSNDLSESPRLFNVTLKNSLIESRIEPYLVDPITNIVVRKGEAFNITTGVRCQGSICGDVTASLDPYNPFSNIVESSPVPESPDEDSFVVRVPERYDLETLQLIVPDVSTEERLDEIKNKISKSGANWTAGLTAPALMSIDEKRSILGNYILPEEEFKISGEIQVASSGIGLPSSFDWRDYNGENWMTPVRNQGSCGSCWSFSVSGVVEAVYNIFSNNPNLDIDISEQQMVSSCCSSCGSCSGGWMTSAFNYIKNTGVADESCNPYTARDSSCRLCSDWQDRKYTIESYFRILPNTNSAYKQALMDYGPLSIGIDASDMFTYYVDGVYEEDFEEVNFTGLNHGIVLVGWSDVGGYWIIRNSWGSSWGQGGYGKMSYGNIEKWGYVYAATVPEMAGKGIIPMNSGNPFYTLNQNPVYPENQSCLSNMQLNDNCNSTWLVNSTEEGVWEFFTIYENADGAEETTHFNVTVFEDNAPTIIQILPDNGHVNTEFPINISFECNVTDDYGLSNVSLYLTNSSNDLFTINASHDLSGLNDGFVWEYEISPGVYTWNCHGFDDYDQSSWGENRTLVIVEIPVDYNFSTVQNESTIQHYGYMNGTMDSIIYDDTHNGLKLLPSKYSGSYISEVFDAGELSDWYEISWSNGSNLMGNSYFVDFNISVMSCNDPLCDSNLPYLEEWTPISGDDFSQLSLSYNQYFRYKLHFYSGNSSYSSLVYNITVNYTYPDTPPEVYLDLPVNYYYNDTHQYVDLTFNASVLDNGDIVNCSLWHNISGLWMQNSSLDVSGKSVNVEFNLIDLSNTYFIWNIYCFDDIGNEGSSPTNYSSMLNWTVPNPISSYSVWWSPGHHTGYDDTLEYVFNVTWDSDRGITNVFLEHDFYGELVNTTASNHFGNSFSEEFVGILPGNRSWRFIANNTYRLENYTDYYNSVVINTTINVTQNVTAIEDITLQWTPTPFTDNYTILYSPTYSGAYNILAEGITDLNWTDLTADGVTERYYLICSIANGIEINTSTIIGKHDYLARNNWSLISVPFDLSTWMLKNDTNENGLIIHTEPEDCLTSIYGYNSVSECFAQMDRFGEEWYLAAGCLDNSISGLEESRGYWFYTDGNCKITFVGEVKNKTINYDLKSGYNLVGWYSSEDTILPTDGEPPRFPIDVNPVDSVTSIFRYNDVDKEFQKTDHYSNWGWWPAAGSESFTHLESMRSYYFMSSQNAIWSYDTK